MPTVNMLEAKTHLSRLVERIEKGEERELSSHEMGGQSPSLFRSRRNRQV